MQPLLKPCPYPSSALDELDCRPLAKDGINRSFAAVYDGQHSPDAAKDAADRLHLILQREDAVVAKHSGTPPFTWDAHNHPYVVLCSYKMLHRYIEYNACAP